MWSSDDIGTRASKHIDGSLRQVFDDLIEENVPSRFEELLERLKDSDAAPSSEAEGAKSLR